MILNYLLDNQSAGFYVDVGAHHPTTFSNTRHFYRLGWHGINIDADPGAVNALERERPRDINLNIGVGEEEGEFDFVRYFEPALNTFDQGTVEQRLEDGIPYDISHVTKIPVRRLEHILGEHLSDGERIDFLSVDVEGQDLEVLRSNDWVAFRPRFVVVEAIGVQDPAEANRSETVQFLASRGYSPVAKTANSLILRDSSNDEQTAASVDVDA
jgi:FkbM family methyltransferase